jgi:anti-anti-sigma factor
MVRVIHLRPRTTVVKLLGEHDLAEKRRLQMLFQRLVVANDLVVVDVSEAQFIDSSVIATLFESARAAKQWGTTVRIQMGTATIVRRALEVSGILEEIEVASSREEALVAVPRVS